MEGYSSIKKIPFKKEYIITQLLADRVFHRVSKATKISTNEEFAVKTYEKRVILKDEKILQIEIEALIKLSHPNLVKIYEVYNEENTLSIVMELITGDELIDNVMSKEEYSEKEAADTIRPIVECLKYCHSFGLSHGLLKLEDLVYSSLDSEATLKMKNFGFSRLFDLSEQSKDNPDSNLSSINTKAPETLKDKIYDRASDCWAFRVIIYHMLCGFPPFFDENDAVLADKIAKGGYDFPASEWGGISVEAKDLIKNLLVVDPQKRLDINQILKHNWIIGENNSLKNISIIKT